MYGSNTSLPLSLTRPIRCFLVRSDVTATHEDGRERGLPRDNAELIAQLSDELGAAVEVLVVQLLYAKVVTLRVPNDTF